MEALEVEGGANVSHITTLTALELFPAAAMIDPLEEIKVTSLQMLIIDLVLFENTRRCLARH